METYICKHCGKTYQADPTLGLWQKDNTQKITKIGVSPKRYCSYECGKAARKAQILNTWENKTPEEIDKINEKRNENKPIRKCVVCGKEFQFTGGTIPICSDKCREKRFHKIPPTGIYYCKNCGKEIHYTEGQGSWNKDNQLVNSKGKNHEHVYKSYNFCCYECGTKYKEKRREKTTVQKHGYLSPWQDIVVREKIFEKMKSNGTLFTSKPEKEIRAFIEDLGFKTDKYIIGDGKTTQRFEIDIYIPEKKIGIEFNGGYFHSINGKKIGYITHNYHYHKSRIALQNGIELVHIWEDQWANQQDIIKDIQTREEAKEDGHYYIINENKHYYYFNNMWNPILRANVGKITYNETGGVISFNPQNVFQAVSKNDTNWVSSQCKPSNRYIDIPLEASATTYISPDNGYVSLRKIAPSVGQFVQVFAVDDNGKYLTGSSTLSPTAPNTLFACTPVRKGGKFSVSYSASGETVDFIFVYDEGAK